MSEIYDNYEQSERVQNWLKENGGAIILGIVVALAAVYGVRYWDNNMQNKRIAAASEYRSIIIALESGNLDAAVEHFQTLKARHKSSSYIGLSALYMARARLEGGQYELAENNYRLALEEPASNEVSIIARQRLARVLLDQGQADEALAVLDSAEIGAGFESRYAEVRGDILVSQNDVEAARTAYQQALDTMETGTGNRELIQLKIDNIAYIVRAPAEEVAAPAEEVTAQAEEVAVPAEEVAAPAEEVTAQAEEVAVPAEEET